ncbi:hypothetical protein H4S08_002680 [Coemansia sp. RSA 1365]|nr:hypothetical protein H4S08_002680 [Coemansia sp. RSA 1365]
MNRLAVRSRRGLSLGFASARIRGYLRPRGLPAGKYSDEVEGVDPVVSPFAIGAGVVFLGSLSYYIYSEYAQSVAGYLPWVDAAVPDTEVQSVTVKEAKAKNSRLSHLREQMTPKSTLLPLEQVRWAWTNPGLYVVGSNEFGLADPLHPDSDSGAGLKCAVPGLEGKLICSVAFSRTHAVAVDYEGCVYQWGTGFAGTGVAHEPTCTLRDTSISEVAASDDFVVLLDKKSRVRLLPASKNISGCISETKLEFEPRLGWRESVTQLSAGKSHIAATTSAGHVYTCALDSSGNSRYQLGHDPDIDVAPLVLKRISSPHRFSAAACGDRHTILLTTEGDVLGCGANDFGQLAMGAYSKENATVRRPTLLRRLWKKGRDRPSGMRAERIAAGATTSFAQVRQDDSIQLLAWGCGIDGQLGNGTLSHLQGNAVKVPALSDKQEYDAASQLRQPLGIRSLAAGSGHVVAVCDNRTNVVLDSSGGSVNQEPLFGYDVVVWGRNSGGQCIPGRKHRFTQPEYPPPLYTSTNSAVSTFAQARLQAAPQQWIPTAQFYGSNARNLPRTLLVQQIFAAGPEVTAAYLKPCK